MSLPAPLYPAAPPEGKRKNRPPSRRPQKRGKPAPSKDKPRRGDDD